MLSEKLSTDSIVWNSLFLKIIDQSTVWKLVFVPTFLEHNLFKTLLLIAFKKKCVYIGKYMVNTNHKNVGVEKFLCF